MLDIFISHSTQDRNVANATLAVLEQRGLRCWMAPRDINPGEEWGDAIIRGIDLCRAMILVFSQHANESRYVKREVERAVSKGMLIVPFRIEDVEPQGAMALYASSVHWLDAFSPPLQAHLEKLADSFGSWLPKTSTADGPSTQKPAILTLHEGDDALLPNSMASEEEVPVGHAQHFSRDTVSRLTNPKVERVAVRPVHNNHPFSNAVSSAIRATNAGSRWKTPALGIDLGTSNTRIYLQNNGILLRQPTLAAVERGTSVVLAVGEAGVKMTQKTLVQPLRDGVIADPSVTSEMLRQFIEMVVGPKKILRSLPQIVLAVPSGITEAEKRIFKATLVDAGTGEIYLMEAPMAAAIGVGLPVQEAVGNMIVNIGAGITEVAIIALSGIVYSRSVRVAGDEFDQAIIDYLKQNHNLEIGEYAAEMIKLLIGSAYPLEKEAMVEVKGHDMVAQFPKIITITSEEVREAMIPPLNTLIDSVRVTLERCPNELSADLVERGIILAGGGSLLRGLDKLLQEETGLPVHVAEDPLSAVAEGVGRALGEIAFLRRMSTREERP